MITQTYSVRSVHESLLRTFHQYLRAQYHIWDEALISERDRIITKPGNTYQEPRLEATPQYASGVNYSALEVPSEVSSILTLASSKPETGIPKIAYEHQCKAIECFIGKGRDLVVATGTGSGKTESFLMPILSSLALEASRSERTWKKPAVRALLLYPMNALVNDQLARLRRLFGDATVSEALQGNSARRATFGMYTSRTPYPGTATPAKNRDRVVAEINKLYFDGMTEEYRARLTKEGKWPAKDLEAFIASELRTGHSDVELLTRHEMQEASPDLLVTNYSMLEYMMLRPMEANIFEQTAEWLHASPDNYLTIVLDEAHMYRGSGGAEVAYLLRRLQSRLQVPRTRIRYILTSASLGSSEEARDDITEFAARLTGGAADQFDLVTSVPELRRSGAQASTSQQKIFAGFDYSSLHTAHIEPEEALANLVRLANSLGIHVEAPRSAMVRMQQFAYELLEQLPVAALVAEFLSHSPATLTAVAQIAFPEAVGQEDAAESLLALMAFARDEKKGRPFCPIRSHLFFRGLAGLYACTNSECTAKAGEKVSMLGRLHANEQLRCECGARVYELLTHRSCGAAYLRGYMQRQAGDFLWHKASNGTWSDEQLVEAQFYVIPPSDLDEVSGDVVWLHARTGRLVPTKPEGSSSGAFLPLLYPSKSVKDRGRDILSDSCPACRQPVRKEAPIAMDLATKGEAPFAHIVRAQVATQPISSTPTRQSPNGGRKTLIFSDGRQKAARLARDIPREIELDVFRQALFIAAQELIAIGQDPRLDGRLYVGFLKCLVDHNLRFFDGGDQSKLEGHIRDFEQIHGGDLASALDELPKPPPSFSALLLKQLGTPYYSISALTLGYAIPSKTALASIRKLLPHHPQEQIDSIAVVWIQRLLSRYAFDMDLPEGVRRKASRYPNDPAEAIDGLSKLQQALLTANGFDVKAIAGVFAGALCQQKPDGSLYLNPSRLVLKTALNDKWVQCEKCHTVWPVLLLGHCPNCTQLGASLVDPAKTSYLRARKGFWRDPVASAIAANERPMSIDVQEHSAQLSYKDADSPAPTTEVFERQFRDILRPGERAVDVLSCTTTMEVGIDIGSLIAVAMRNVPPMRQNYQQRAGRAGRRGSAVSTVVTYAQSGAHDAYYFSNPDRMLAGDPPKPVLDTTNERIAARHVYAQLLQDFFRPLAGGKKTSDIFTALGDTWEFFTSDMPSSFVAFTRWLLDAKAGKDSIARAQQWLPVGMDANYVARHFVEVLRNIAPSTKEGLELSFIEFLFGHGLLPSYAFPRDLCSLQVQESTGGSNFKVCEQAQQGMNVALSEYAPGRLVVLNKKTYRIGTVAASGPDTEPNRAEPLFEQVRIYKHCTECTFTAGFVASDDGKMLCPQCGSESLRSVSVIRPEIVYPSGKREIDEFDDEQVFSRVTQAQLPMPDSDRRLETSVFGRYGGLAATRTQNLVVVNEGDPSSAADGFRVCVKCGKVLLEGEPEVSHTRDYYIKVFKGQPPGKCDGEFRRVFLGYDFPSDILLLRVALNSPLRFGAADRRKRKPLEDALQTLCDALTLSIARVLDVDSREMSAGFRFGSDGKSEFADIFVYDTLSGGAGYALEARKSFATVFDEAVRLMKDCTCSASCENCLRHYGNRFHHSDLDRNLGLDFSRYILRGEVPEEMAPDQEREALMPLIELIKLAGWEVVDTEAKVRVEHQGKRFILSACPSLRACEARVSEGGTLRLTFTPYELSRDLPNAFAELS
ncbi:DEAD/DEAH box helicase [Luteimonas sp. RIT-PG2_3]